MKPDAIASEGMAKAQKPLPSPTTFEAPKALVPLMQAFHVDSDKVAKSLIFEAVRAIYGKNDFGRDCAISKSEMYCVISLMRCVSPRDSLETLFATQIVVGHLLGMRKLAESCSDDRKLGLNLLRFSNEAMQQLEKKRSGVTQNIVVNYSYSDQTNDLIQTVLTKGKN